MNKKVCRNRVSDGALLLILCIIHVGFFFVKPPIRGFICNDATINYPYKNSTIGNGTLLAVSILLPCFLIVLIELYKQKMKTRNPRFVCTKFYKSIIKFALGFVMVSLFTYILKTSLGELRPHFFDVCRPNSTICTFGVNKYISPDEYVCTSKHDDKTKEARLSFPSGHASISWYSAVFLAIFLQKCTFNLKIIQGFYSVLFSLIQYVVISMAAYCSLSRITDNKHHPIDVAMGTAIGILVAILISLSNTQLASLLRRKITKENSENNSIQVGAEA